MCAPALRRRALSHTAPRAPPDSPPAAAGPPSSPQVRYFQVSEDELMSLRERFEAGQYEINIEHKTFSMADYTKMVNGERQLGVQASCRCG